MNKTISAVLVVVASLALGLFSNRAQAQPAPKVNSSGGMSPHETISTNWGTMQTSIRVTITYGRPFSKDPKSGAMRKIWGTLIPWAKAWRMGSDEATTMITQFPLAFGETTVPAGAYTLYMVPVENGTSKLAISTKIGGWGIPVDEKNDLARIDVKKETIDTPVDQFTIKIDKDPSNPASGGILKWSWENTQYSVPFTIKK